MTTEQIHLAINNAYYALDLLEISSKTKNRETSDGHHPSRV